MFFKKRREIGRRLIKNNSYNFKPDWITGRHKGGVIFKQRKKGYFMEVGDLRSRSRQRFRSVCNVNSGNRSSSLLLYSPELFTFPPCLSSQKKFFTYAKPCVLHPSNASHLVSFITST